MKLYRFSPILDQSSLLDAINHIHYSCYRLCKQTLGSFLPNAGNMSLFCHYDDEYETLSDIRRQLTHPSDDPDQKYFKLYSPIVISSRGDLPQTTYTYLHIRHPDPYRHQVGDVDFYLKPSVYQTLKSDLLSGKKIKCARIFERLDLDMIELFDPDIDALAYLSTGTPSSTLLSIKP